MIYSSNAGYDLRNNDVYIDSVLSEEICQIFYDHKEQFNPIDFGGGVFGIGVTDVLEVLKDAKLVQKFLNASKTDAVDIYLKLTSANNSRAYLV